MHRSNRLCRSRGPSAYADSALVSELARICDAPEGTRNNELNRAAFGLGQLVGGGLLDLAPVEAALIAAGERAGLDPGETARTVKSGLGKGMAQPRRLETVR